jgi:hypothetical protein
MLDATEGGFSSDGSWCRGLLGTVLTVAKEEGPGALWAGLEPSKPSALRHFPCNPNVRRGCQACQSGWMTLQHMISVFL